MKISVGAAALLIVVLLAGPAFSQVSLGIRIGAPPAPKVLKVRPAAPGPDYVWVDGYWNPVNGKYAWHPGYWSRPPYEGARWVAPHHDGSQFFAGYWEGGKGRVEHDHKWDKEKERDFHHDR